MYIRLQSDLHCEFRDHAFSKLKNDKDTVMILAGDIGVFSTFSSIENIIADASKQFKYVLYVLGNHCFYHSDWETVRNQMPKLLAKYKNVTVLDDSVKIIDDVAFVGSTLWTDYNKNNYDDKYYCGRALNDHFIIGKGLKSFTPDDAYAQCMRSVNWMFKTINDPQYADKKIVIVTHHGMSKQSTHPKYQGSNINAAFVSDFEQEFLDSNKKIAYAFHGHIHDYMEYNIGETKVIANPKGYPHEYAGNGFKPNLLLEI